LTNPDFGRLTHHLMDTHPDDLRDLLLLNRQSVVHYLDALMENLGALRDVLQSNRRDALETALIDAAQQYHAWGVRRRKGEWDKPVDPPPSGASLMTGLMGDYLARRLRGDRNGEK
jgi:hypothetical protein